MKIVSFPLGLFAMVMCVAVVACFVVSPIRMPAGVYPILIGLLMVMLWAAWAGTFGKIRFELWRERIEVNTHIHRFMADILVVIFIFVYRRVKSLHLRRGLERVRAQQDQIDVAQTGLDIQDVHPKLAARTPTSVVIGYNPRHKPIWIDLKDNHVSIGASTGGGKTALIRLMLLQLIQKPEGSRPLLTVIDLKGNAEDGLVCLQGIPGVDYVSDIDGALHTLRMLVKEMDARNAGDKSVPHVIIMDEIADLTSEHADYKRPSISLLSLLARKARSANMHMIVATQHARFDVVPKSIMYNLLTKIILVMDTRSQAEVVLGYRPEFDLPTKPGEFVLKSGISLQRGQAVWSPADEIQSVIRNIDIDFDDARLKFWKLLTRERKVGAGLPGQMRIFDDNKEFAWVTQPFVRECFENFKKAGLISEALRGQSSKLLVGFLPGVAVLHQYITEKWDA